MKKIFLSVACLLLVFTNVNAEEVKLTPYKKMPKGEYQLDKAHASLVWKVSHMGLSDYTARFTDFDANIYFNPEVIERSSVNVTINPASLKTDYPFADKKDFDKKLTDDEEWFNVNKFPKIQFVSKEIVPTSRDTASIVGDLTFMGVTKTLQLDATFNGAMAKNPYSKKPTLGFSATAILKRSDWGFETLIPKIGDEVEILIEAEFVQNEKP